MVIDDSVSIMRHTCLLIFTLPIKLTMNMEDKINLSSIKDKTICTYDGFTGSEAI